MSNKSSTVQVLDEIERICITENKQLLDQGFDHQVLTSIVLGIEWLGGLLDGKPFGVKNQSRKRFELALRHFPKLYFKVHHEIDLYRQLRNRAIHNPWSESKYLELTEDAIAHCSYQQGIAQISLDQFLSDFQMVIEKLKAKTC